VLRMGEGGGTCFCIKPIGQYLSQFSLQTAAAPPTPVILPNGRNVIISEQRQLRSSEDETLNKPRKVYCSSNVNKPQYATMLLVLVFIVHLHYMFRPLIGGHLQVISDKIYSKVATLYVLR
jgi:hypothetical protein